MIIFNVYAIAVLAIIAVIVVPIYWLLPDSFAESPMGQIILMTIATVIAGLCEIGGLKGRLFFLPMWIIGIIGTIGFTYVEFGWIGIASLVGILALVLGLFFILLYSSEKSDWKNAFNHFLELKKIKHTENKAFWEQVKKSIFIPSMMSYSHRICEHNLEVLTYMKSLGIEWEEMDALVPVFQQASVQGNTIDIESELTDAFEARLSETLYGFEEKE